MLLTCCLIFTPWPVGNEAMILRELGLASSSVYENPGACQDSLGQASKRVVREKGGEPEKTGGGKKF